MEKVRLDDRIGSNPRRAARRKILPDGRKSRKDGDAKPRAAEEVDPIRRRKNSILYKTETNQVSEIGNKRHKRNRK